VLLTREREREREREKEKKKGGWGERIESFHFLHQLRKQGVCHIVALPFTLKSILRQKEELRKLKYFTMQKYNLQKILPKKHQNPSRNYYNSITNLKFQHNLAKILSFKILILKKIDLLL
jgi:hypothetical protein